MFKNAGWKPFTVNRLVVNESGIKFVQLTQSRYYKRYYNEGLDR